MTKKRLGDRLLEAGIIDKLQLRAALGQQASWGKTLGRTLLEMRLISEEQLLPILSVQLNMPAINLGSVPLNPEAAAMLDEDFCRKYECFPFNYSQQGKFLDMAMTDAQSGGLFDQIRVRTRCNVRPFLAGPEAIKNAIDQAYGEDIFDGVKTPQFMLTDNIIDFVDEAEAAPKMPKPGQKRRRSKSVVLAPAVQQAPPEDELPPGDEPPVSRGEMIQARRNIVALREHIRRQDQYLKTLVGQLRQLFGLLSKSGALDVSPGHPLVGDTGLHPTVPEPQEAAAHQKSPPKPAEPDPGPPSAGPGPAVTELAPLDHKDSIEIEVDVIFDGVDLEEPAAKPKQATPPAGKAKPDQTTASKLKAALADTKTAAKPASKPDRPLGVRPMEPATKTKPPAGKTKREAIRPPAERVRPAAPPPELEDVLPLVNVPADSPTVVAMDLGTTRCSVAAVIEGKVSVLKLPGGDWDMPSVVGFRHDGSVMLGNSARKMLASDPVNAITSPKRLLGRRFDERALQPYLASLAMETSRGARSEVMLHAQDKTITVTEACAHLLNLLRLIAEKRLGHDVREVILTAPVAFTDQQYAALHEAAELADLRVLEIVDEPVAAALSCVSDPACKGLVAVFDFGGGTFDFSVVDVGAETMEVITSAGDTWLGGDDFDEALANAAADAFWRSTEIELRNQAEQWQRLLMRAELTKRALSEKEEANLELPEAALTAEGSLDLVFPVTRKLFSTVSAEIIQRALSTCSEALELNDLKPGDMSAVYLSGGTTYVPAVREAVAAFFGQQPRVVVPAEHAVLVGAAIHGALFPQEIARRAGG